MGLARTTAKGGGGRELVLMAGLSVAAGLDWGQPSTQPRRVPRTSEQCDDATTRHTA